MEKMVSTKKAAKILGVSVSTISRWFDRNVLTGEKNPLTNWRRISVESIENLLKSFNLSLPVEKPPTPDAAEGPIPEKKEENPPKGVDEKNDTN